MHIWSVEKWSKPDLPDCLVWLCNVCILTMWLYMTFLEVLQRNGYDLHVSLKAELSISAMWLQAVMSVSRCTLLCNVWPLVVWFNVIVIRMLKYQMANKIKECIVLSPQDGESKELHIHVTRVGYNLCNPHGLLTGFTSTYEFWCIGTLVNLYWIPQEEL